MGDTGSMAETWDVGPDTVKIMTVHGAKGLEFKNVFVVSLVDKRFPSIERKEQIPLPDALVKEIVPEGDIHLEEERRLFYVAMTRAKDGLFLTSAEDYGGARKKKPSRFLVELGFIPKLEKSSKGPFDEIEKPATLSDEEKLIRSRIPKQFSFTQFQAYEICPKQYKYAHILQIPAGKRHTFSFGKSMHAVMLKFFQEVQERGSVGSQDNLFHGVTPPQSKGIVMPESRLIELLKDEWINEWYESSNHEKRYFEKGKEELKKFAAVHAQGYPIPLYLEKGFFIKIDEQTVKGSIDRIDALNGGAHLIDYKTGTAPSSVEELHTEDLWQLYLYAKASRDVLGLLPRMLSFYYFEAGAYFSVPWNEDDEKKILDLTKESIHAILMSSFIPTPSEWKCSHCDFRDICEDRSV
jgi:DNA helicase-2/ATP-dependent DNA helicase PcrA